MLLDILGEPFDEALPVLVESPCVLNLEEGEMLVLKFLEQCQRDLRMILGHVFVITFQKLVNS